ncbi:uncharacterized protein B0P05DRAFT_584700 [Gilbertella persicaria]|uniref:uncharacterized protein n=1 Tax=Gilbertella persicaria TaxID=101096 RepID=UPI002220C0A0|nr:uncharacterized protein B0P05DRAFT_584700 [Gilbertella persicaria]KAI8087990.1 hypothetical protein B0P05DRAFT_584700 [Gilbertella persicaria]
MSKKEANYYYSYSSPPVQGSTTSAPTEPSGKNSAQLPSYDQATEHASSSSETYHAVDGYILDSSAMQMPMPNTTTSDYGPYNSTIENDAPLLAEHEDNNQFMGRPPPPNYSIHQAKYEIVRDGVVSRDSHINQDGEALLQFLYQHNKAPYLIIHFHGYHEETVWTMETTRNRDGEEVTERVPTTRQIDDFKFDIDCSAEVSPVCHGIYVLPDAKTGEQKAVRQLCEDYVRSQNALKELKLTKEIHWDFNNLTRALTAAIRDSGYFEHINITYTLENNEIVVKTDEKISQLMDNKYIRFFFFITCLWIIAWPLVYYLKDKFGHSTLKSAWKMSLSESEWYERHAQEIVQQCRGQNCFSSRTIHPTGFPVNTRL